MRSRSSLRLTDRAMLSATRIPAPSYSQVEHCASCRARPRVRPRKSRRADRGECLATRRVRRTTRARRVVIRHEDAEELVERAALLAVERSQELLLDPLHDRPQLGELALAGGGEADEVAPPVDRV